VNSAPSPGCAWRAPSRCSWSATSTIPIEPLISAAAAGNRSDRRAIAEVGNLAASDTGSARLSIIAITWLLAMAGLEWVAFTGNIGLVNSFHRLGLKPVTLSRADPHAPGR